MNRRKIICFLLWLWYFAIKKNSKLQIRGSYSESKTFLVEFYRVGTWKESGETRRVTLGEKVFTFLFLQLGWVSSSDSFVPTFYKPWLGFSSLDGCKEKTPQIKCSFSIFARIFSNFFLRFVQDNFFSVWTWERLQGKSNWKSNLWLSLTCFSLFRKLISSTLI